MAKKNEQRFEDALGKLEEIVVRMEEGDLPLDESLRLFEEGMGLSKMCRKKLDEAEKKIEIIVKESGGDAVEPFAVEGE